MRDIQNKEDIQTMVNTFYAEVRKDDMIGPVFHARIPEDRWPSHLEKMYSFWYTVLFGKGDYRGNPFSKHAQLPIAEEHFERWLHLFFTNLDAHFQGERADEAKSRAEKMAIIFSSKLKFLRENKQYRSIV